MGEAMTRFPCRLIKAVSAENVWAINRSAVLAVIRCSGLVTRSQIAVKLGLNLSTVKRIVSELLSEGLVIENLQNPSDDKPKQNLLEFNGVKFLVLGIDLGGTKIYGAVTNLNGEILYETTFAHRQNQAEGSFEVVLQVLNNLIQFAESAHLSIMAIGIGVPGVVESATGNVILAPALDWSDFPLRERLAERYTYPVIIENDVNLAALGEVYFGTAEEVHNLILLAIGTGIGAGIVIDDEIYRGSHQMAGEVGYFLPDRSHLGLSYPDFGAFERIASGTGIAERGRTVLQELHSPLALESLTALDIFTAAQSGENWAEQVLSETVDYLAQLIAAISLILDPDIILLGGGVGKSADGLIGSIQDRLIGSIPIQPRVQKSSLGYRAAVMGTIVLAVRQYLSI